MPRILIILGCALLATACAKNSDQASPADSLVQTFHTESPAAAAALQNSSKSVCADTARCTAAVGLFTGKQGADVSACTAFLVGEDLAVTNSHCIPSAVKLSPSLCSDRVRISFPASGEIPEETLHCKELIALTERPNDISPDLALIRLEHSTQRAPLPTQLGVIPGDSLTAFKMNPIRDDASLTGRLEVETCPATANTYLFPLYQTAMDPVFVAGCHSVPGNSGSPVVGFNGVVGVLQAQLRLFEAQRNAWLPYLDKLETDFAPLALGTNLRCLDVKSGKLDPSCKPLSEDDIVRPRLQEFIRTAELSAETSLLLQPYTQQTADFQWQREITERHALEQIETLRPACVRGTSGSDPAATTARVPTFKTKLAFNRYLQPRAHVELLGEATQAFRFSRFDLSRTGESKVESSSGTSWTISACE